MQTDQNSDRVAKIKDYPIPRLKELEPVGVDCLVVPDDFHIGGAPLMPGWVNQLASDVTGVA